MDALFRNVSSIVRKDIKVEIYSQLNQHLVGSANTILWNESCLVMDPTTYEQFRLAIKPKACRFYTLNSILPFHDFCIALLYTVDYGLNHITIPQVKDRTFVSAWRTMSNLRYVAESSVREWIESCLNDRGSDGYCSTLGISRQNVPMTRRLSDRQAPPKFAIDAKQLGVACLSGNVIDITNNMPRALIPIVTKVSSTPEGHLDNLRIVHKLLLNRAI